MTINNSQILYLYDAKLANPNGDPDEENRPRMDLEREMNLVSDVRIKRYIRDYAIDKGERLFVQQEGDKPETAKQRASEYTKESILDAYMDIRLFGGIATIKKDNYSYTGPVQFNWGYSLNKVDVLDAGITTRFSSKEGNNQGSMGRDYRVKYSFIAFSGLISGKRAEITKLREEDVNFLDEAMKKAIPLMATRSKIGQMPRLYLRVEYQNRELVLNDFRGFLDYQEKCADVRDIREVSLEIGRLIDYLEKYKAEIACIHYYQDEELNLLKKGQSCNAAQALSGFNLKEC